MLAAVLSLAMILTLANPTTVFAAEKDGTEQSGGFWHNAVESIADFFGFGDDEADAGAQTRIRIRQRDVIRHLRILMDREADAMPAVVTDDTVAELPCVA